MTKINVVHQTCFYIISPSLLVSLQLPASACLSIHLQIYPSLFHENQFHILIQWLENLCSIITTINQMDSPSAFLAIEITNDCTSQTAGIVHVIISLLDTVCQQMCMCVSSQEILMSAQQNIHHL